MTAGVALPRAVTRRGRPGESRWPIVVAWLLGGVFGLPVLVMLVRALGGGALAAAIGTRVVLDALVLSLVTTACSLVLVVLIGLPLALVLARRRFRGSWLLETIVDLPIVLPPSVAGLALLLVLGRRGLLGEPLDLAFGISIPFTTIAVIIAQVFVAAPFFVRSARSGFATVNRDLEDAARVDGARERDVLRWVTLPMASTALAAGLAMAWARALGEFGATIMFAGNVTGRTQTLPLLVYGEFQGGDLDASIAAAAVLVLAAAGVLASVRLLRTARALDTAGA